MKQKCLYFLGLILGISFAVNAATGLDGTKTKVMVPPKGSTFVWETSVYDRRSTPTEVVSGIQFGYPTWSTTDSSMVEIRWKILEQPSDSAGWVRATVEQTTRTMYTLTVRVPGKETVSILLLRWKRGSILPAFRQDYYPNPSSSSGLDYSAFQWRVGDTVSSEWLTRRFRWNSDVWMEGELYQRMDPSGGIDSFQFADYSYAHYPGEFSSTRKNVTRLISRNGEAIRRSWFEATSVVPHTIQSRSQDLRALAVARPEAKVRWWDVSGHGGVLSLREFVNPARRLGTSSVGYEVESSPGKFSRGTWIVK